MNIKDTQENIIELLKLNYNKFHSLNIIYKKYIKKYNVIFNNNDDKVFFDKYFLNSIRIIKPKYNNIQIKTSKYFITHLKISQFQYEYNDDSDSDESCSSNDSFENEYYEENKDFLILNYYYSNLFKSLIKFIVDSELEEFYLPIDYKNNNILHYLVNFNDSYPLSKIIESVPLKYLVDENNYSITPLDSIYENNYLKNIIYKKIIYGISKIDEIEDLCYENKSKFNYKFLIFSFLSISFAYFIYTKQD